MFHENLKQLRKERKLSQEELAKRLSISQQAVAKWETHQASPSLDMLIKLAKVLEVSLDALIGESHPSATPSLLQTLSQEYHLDKLDRKLIHFYLELEPETRDKLKKHLLLLVDYLLNDESSYEKYRNFYIKENALPYAARHGDVSGMINVQQEYDENPSNSSVEKIR